MSVFFPGVFKSDGGYNIYIDVKEIAELSQHKVAIKIVAEIYRKVSNIRRTKFQNLNASRLIW